MTETTLQTLLRGYSDRSVVDDKEVANGGTNRYNPPSSDDLFRCNICGQDAEYIIQLELVKERSNYNVMEHINNMPFYLCKAHEYVYKRMRTSIELKNYFAETIKVNQ
ncbi:MAG TPA: hypothetical protein VIP70_12335 [Nitrososphaeraceae archaeon]